MDESRYEEPWEPREVILLHTATKKITAIDMITISLATVGG
jgi:hypothetical protein